MILLPQFGSEFDRRHPQLNKLACWLPFLENGGTTAYDYSGWGQHGSYANTTGNLYSSGDYGPSITLDSTNDYLTLPATLWGSGHWTANQPITLCCWVKKASAPVGSVKTVVQKWDSPFSFWFHVTTSGYPGFYIYDGATRGPAIGTVSCCDGTWHFIHATYDGSTLRAGTDIGGFGTAAGSTAITASSSAVSVNSRTVDTTYVLGASYADIRMYARVLSDGELADVANNPWAMFDADEFSGVRPVAAATGGSIAPHVMYYKRMMTG